MIELDPRAQDHEIKAHALWSMGRVRSYLASVANMGPTAAPGLTDDGVKTVYWTQPAPQDMRLHATTSESMEQELNDIAATCYARPCAETVPLAGRIARMSDAAWWIKNLRRETLKRNETIEHAAGHIRRKGQCYASDHAHHTKRARAKASREMLEGLECVNEDGQAFNMLDCVDGSVSNPKVRRGELMTRARGFEETAELFGHVAVFLTITCPSRFHRWNAAGQQNQKWIGDTPRDAQDYLCAVWAKIRAAWGRKKCFPYGFRVAEPHHDACPHWHILLFVQVGHVEKLCSIAQRYALKDTPTERGAIKHRFTVERIDTTRGSATGYIAKYIAKNIDGLTEAGDNVGLDFASGTKASDASARVRTWASTWSIRQFQQIGGPSVTVWRELRRLGEVDRAATPDMFAGPQDAADNAAWAMFWMLQGGPNVPRKMLTLKPVYEEGDQGKYGDIVKRITGVSATKYCMVGRVIKDKFKLVPSVSKCLFLKTRLHTWTVQRAGMNAINEFCTERRQEVKAAANVERFLSEAKGFGIDFADAGRAWTGVNNCTVSPEKNVFTEFDFSGFEPGGGEIPYSPEYSRRGDPLTVAQEVTILELELCQQQKQWNQQRSYDNLRKI